METRLCRGRRRARARRHGRRGQRTRNEPPDHGARGRRSGRRRAQARPCFERRGQRGAGCLPLNGFGCHRAVVRCALRGSNRQIHRQRALSDGAGAGSATRTTYGPHVLSAPPGSIPAHATTVPLDPGIHHGTGRRRVSRYRPLLGQIGMRHRASGHQRYRLVYRSLHARSHSRERPAVARPCDRPRRALWSCLAAVGRRR